MPSLRDIRHRIKSVGSTAQITRAMQMVAASKMRKAQQSALTTRPFGQLLYRIQRRAITHARDFTHPLLEVREVRKRAVILVGTDKGLCGSLNANLFRAASHFDPQTTVYIAVGKRAAQFIARTRRQLAAEFAFTDTPRYGEARPIATLARDLFLKGEVDQVQVVATRFINTKGHRHRGPNPRRRDGFMREERVSSTTPSRSRLRARRRPRQNCRRRENRKQKARKMTQYNHQHAHP